MDFCIPAQEGKFIQRLSSAACTDFMCKAWTTEGLTSPVVVAGLQQDWDGGDMGDSAPTIGAWFCMSTG